jgi:hypothetical protein
MIMRALWWVLLAGSVAHPLTSGLQVGEAVPSFQPVHVTGPDRGTQACPIARMERDP